jgi:hypothetical protein
MLFAIRPLANWTAAEAKRGVTGIAAWPTAGHWIERVDFLGGGQARAGEGGRCRLDQERGGRPGLGADGGLLDLGNRHRLRGQEAGQDDDSVWDAAIAIAPASDASWADAEQPSNACDPECAECCAEFSRGRVNDHDDVI